MLSEERERGYNTIFYYFMWFFGCNVSTWFQKGPYYLGNRGFYMIITIENNKKWIRMFIVVIGFYCILVFLSLLLGKQNRKKEKEESDLKGGVESALPTYYYYCLLPMMKSYALAR
ncbi:hypothetical protein F4775DRAFT_527561 [Biscogniauxia sp. FL1348]|nr:hypothetical protein F4775DRAFT_527561 [Biscogniauxia sp. FL1348]